MMTLIRQVWLMLFGVLLFAWTGSVVTHTLMARQSLRAQMQVRNADGAMMLALALSQQKGDESLMKLLAEAQFDTGHYRLLRLLRDDGSVLFERQASAQALAAPAWFARALPIEAEPREASLSNGWRAIGRVQLASHASWAVDELWAGCLRMAGWLAVLGAVAALLVALAVRGWRRPLDAAVAQAQALEESRFVVAEEPRVPELQRLTRSMNSLVQRLQGVFERQASQLEELRTQAHLDSVTGLLKRGQFTSQLSAALGAERQRGAGLLLIRLRGLEAMNRRIGHDSTDRLLAALAQVLQSYPRHVKGALAGRLNGSDFALYLPASGMAVETAGSLVEALRAALATVDQGAELVIGGTELPQAMGAPAALSIADAALAQAEGSGAFAVEVEPGPPADGRVLGEQQWHERITDALQAGRIELAEYALRGPQGELLHLECPARLQLEAAGSFEPAAQWLAMAARCRLVHRLDLAVLQLALEAIRRDGLPRCINMAAASLAASGFVYEVQRCLEAAPTESARLCIDFVEVAALQPQRLREAGRLWRRSGVRIGLEHAGANLRELARLHTLGVDYVKIDGAFVQGAASTPAVRELARGLVTLLRGMDLQVLAEAVADETDLAALWALGFDGATGPAVQPH